MGAPKKFLGTYPIVGIVPRNVPLKDVLQGELFVNLCTYPVWVKKKCCR